VDGATNCCLRSSTGSVARIVEGTRRGFTLIELLAVLAVLTLLAGFLLPVLARARDAAGRTRCLSNLRQLALAHQVYVQDYDEVLPPWKFDTIEDPRIWTNFLRPYYRDPRLLDQGFTTPTPRGQWGWAADYAMCAWGPGGRGTLQEPYWRWPGAPDWDFDPPLPMPLAAVRRPVETLQFIDGFTAQNGSGCYGYHSNGLRNGVFVDGHAHVISSAAWYRVGQDERGYFLRMASADR
jgi:prepilin-type N-terminal cleavage/methylation domain-containing protein/prepilin-type processing-associated H-X9-DG protein